MKKLAIIGASAFQNPLILKAQELGIETHVFAWAAGDVGEKTADHFYPISIVDRDAILAECERIGIDGVCTIGSDLANIAVSYIAEHMGLVANSWDCVQKSTDKHLMRQAFEVHGDPSPASYAVDANSDLSTIKLTYPVIVKPADRSGSRGITKLEGPAGLEQAVSDALEPSFSKIAMVEEFATGREFSIEHISWKGEHRFLAVTEKFTTGAPHFIETGHLVPARITPDEQQRIRKVVEHALDSLGVEYGASHAEVKLAADGSIKIIEIGSRMGGDCIGSDLVQLATGYDFMKAVIDVALGQEPDPVAHAENAAAAIRFVFSQDDLDALHRLKKEAPDLLESTSDIAPFDHQVTDSSTRYGFFIMKAERWEDFAPYLPDQAEERA